PLYKSSFSPFFHSFLDLLHLHSFPTRRSSDLAGFVLFTSINELSNFDSIQNDDSYLPNNSIFKIQLKFIGNIFMSSSKCYIIQRSEEHTSELQSRENLVCRLLLEKKNTIYKFI